MRAEDRSHGASGSGQPSSRVAVSGRGWRAQNRSVPAMRTFDQSLFELYQAGEISYEDALRYADSQNEVRLRIKLSQGGDAKTLSQGLDGVEISEVR